MDGINNPFTKWCVDEGLTEDGDSYSRGSLITAINCLLNDAAVQKQGEQFDPEKLLRSRLEKINKPELITLVQNFAWFLYQVVEPYVTSVDGHWARQVEHSGDISNGMVDKVNTLESALEKAQAKLDVLQEKVISLQDELLKEKNNTIEKLIGSVQTTVKDELKSYASVVQKSCSASLAPAKLQAVMKKVATEEDRSCNLMIYGLEEATDENTESAALSVIQHTDEKPKLVSCRRLGDKNAERRPIKVTFQSREMARSVLTKSTKLRQVEGYSRVYLGPDRTLEQRRERKKLLGVLNEKRDNFPEKKFIIRRGVVTELDS